MNFEASNTDAARQAALAEAAQRARVDSETLTRTMGGRLGALLELSTADADDGFASRRVALAYMHVSDQTAITPSEITVSISVIGRWQYLP